MDTYFNLQSSIMNHFSHFPVNKHKLLGLIKADSPANAVNGIHDIINSGCQFMNILSVERSDE